MSWLRGPLTRAEIGRLQPITEPFASVARVAPTVRSDHNHVPPLPSGFAQAFLDPEVVFSSRLQGKLQAFAEAPQSDGLLIWKPALWGEVALRFDEDKGGFLLDELHHYLFFPLGERLPERWLRLELEASDLLSSWRRPARYEPLPASFDESREFKAAQQAMLDDVYRRVTSSQWIHADLKLYGAGGESEDDFRARVDHAIQERIDAQVAKLHARVDREVATLQDRLARHEGKLDNLRNESERRQTESMWKAGAAVLGFFTGSKRSLNTALTSHHRSHSAKDRVRQGENELAALQQNLDDLQQQLKTQVDALEAREGAARHRIEARRVRLDRADISLRRFGILWIPVTRRV